MKRIHIPTLIMHLLLLLLAMVTIGDYPDFFLGAGILVLILHAAWAIESKKNLLPAHFLGSALYLLAQPLGLIRIEGGFWGMGSDFGWLFYGFALIASLALETVIVIVKHFLKRKA